MKRYYIAKRENISAFWASTEIKEDFEENVNDSVNCTKETRKKRLLKELGQVYLYPS